MSTILYIATVMGIYIAAQTNGQWEVVSQTLTEQSLTSIGVSEKIILAGTRDGVWRSTNQGRSWQPANKNLTIRHIRWISGLTGGAPGFLAGTEPAGIYVSHDGARTWQMSTEVELLRDLHGWYLPYSPEKGCVRDFSMVDTGEGQSRIYAAVEVGGVLFSNDRGLKWQLANGSDGKPVMNRELGTMIHPDVHAITVHAGNKDVVTAATGGGLYRSIDGGRTWRNIYECYMRAVWVNSKNHLHMIAGPADGVSRNGRIESTTDGGSTWRTFSAGLQAPWDSDMAERFVYTGEELLSILSNGELWASPVNKPNWERILPDIPEVKAVAVAIAHEVER